MAREIKFRAAQGGKLFEVTEILWSDRTVYLSNLKEPDFEGMTSLDDVELLQFTGLLDKNGKEIYEGDVVRCLGYQGETIEQPVMWHGSGWYVGYDNGKECKVTSFDALTESEVIGNIYETPELLS